MTLRAGSYDKSQPEWQGLIRSDGLPVYVCYHEHKNSDAARACAKKALENINKDNTLPPGWGRWGINA